MQNGFLAQEQSIDFVALLPVVSVAPCLVTGERPGEEQDDHKDQRSPQQNRPEREVGQDRVHPASGYSASNWGMISSMICWVRGPMWTKRMIPSASMKNVSGTPVIS